MIRKILTLALIFAATAASAHFPIAQRLRQIDTNHDRALSLAEVLNARHARFVALDLDRNQVLTLAEVSNKLNSRRQKSKHASYTQDSRDRLSERFARLDQNQDRLDQNQDSRITQAEWNGKVAELFARFDVNNDQFITRPEVSPERDTANKCAASGKLNVRNRASLRWLKPTQCRS